MAQSTTTEWISRYDTVERFSGYITLLGPEHAAISPLKAVIFKLSDETYILSFGSEKSHYVSFNLKEFEIQPGFTGTLLLNLQDRRPEKLKRTWEVVFVDVKSSSHFYHRVLHHQEEAFCSVLARAASDIRDLDVVMSDPSSVSEPSRGVDKAIVDLCQAMANISTQLFPPLSREPTEQTHQERKIAVVGMTGAGKSALVNAILGSPLLPTICTSTVTEVSFMDIDGFQITLSFVSKAEWADSLQKFYELSSTREGTDTLLEKSEIFGVYPQLRASPSLCWTIDELMSEPHVASLLGQHKTVVASDLDELREEIDSFLGAHLDKPDKSSLWPLVKIAYIKGRFDTLATATLVDLPGHCDGIPARSVAVETYMKTADHILIVADVRTAYNDVKSHQYIEKILQNGVINGRVFDSMMTVVLTGADREIGDREVRLNNEQYTAVEQCIELQKNTAMAMARLRLKPGAQTNIDCVSAKIADLRERHDMAKASKYRIFNEVRAESLHRALEGIHHMAVKQLLGKDIQPPALPVFYVGSRDYLSLIGCESDVPCLFKSEEDTGIPLLRQHIGRIGKRPKDSSADDILRDAIALLGQAASFNKEMTLGRKEMSGHGQATATGWDMLEHAREAIDEALFNLQTAVNSLVASIKSEAE
ncbi:hypothetical protein PLICRDRAFT_174265 [Plicaturopsis crispa FD-325 SS-3]|nr:hypothetical protein PLICRDRAFT_174265 [Plicaturopsis crispa FD-325 SS-3]